MEPARQQRVRSPDQGFSSVEGHSDAQVRIVEKCWAIDKKMEQWQEICPYPEKNALLFFYRPFSITAVVRSGVMAIVE